MPKITKERKRRKKKIRPKMTASELLQRPRIPLQRFILGFENYQLLLSQTPQIGNKIELFGEFHHTFKNNERSIELDFKKIYTEPVRLHMENEEYKSVPIARRIRYIKAIDYLSYLSCMSHLKNTTYNVYVEGLPNLTYFPTSDLHLLSNYVIENGKRTDNINRNNKKNMLKPRVYKINNMGNITFSFFEYREFYNDTFQLNFTNDIFALVRFLYDNISTFSHTKEFYDSKDGKQYVKEIQKYKKVCDQIELLLNICFKDQNNLIYYIVDFFTQSILNGYVNENIIKYNKSEQPFIKESLHNYYNEEKLYRNIKKDIIHIFSLTNGDIRNIFYKFPKQMMKLILDITSPINDIVLYLKLNNQTNKNILYFAGQNHIDMLSILFRTNYKIKSNNYRFFSREPGVPIKLI